MLKSCLSYLIVFPMRTRVKGIGEFGWVSLDLPTTGRPRRAGGRGGLLLARVDAEAGPTRTLVSPHAPMPYDPRP